MDMSKPRIGILRWEGGKVPEGLMQLERMTGNSTNPASYPFPVKMVEVKGATTETVIIHPSREVLSRMIEIVKEMEKEGILSRKRGDHDKRQHIVNLTAKGKRLEKKAYELIPAAMGERLADCPLSLEEYQHLAQELDAIINSFKR